LINRIYREEKGITGLETAIILIAFVVVASVFAYTVLSSGLFATEKSKEAIFSALEGVEGTLEIRGSIIGYKDTLNAAGNGSLGRIDLTLTQYSQNGKVDLTPAFTIDTGTGALTHSNPGANRLQISFVDKYTTISDCAWTVNYIGKNNGDIILDYGEKAVISVWLHTFDGTIWGPTGGENSHFLGTNYLDTYHKFNLEVKPANGATLIFERTTPAFLDKVTDLH
jgi:archaeal flagellin FlaB